MVKVGAKKKRVVVALDACSNTTNIDEDLARELDMPVARNSVTREICFMERQARITSNLVVCSIAPLNSKESFQIQGFTIKNLVKGTPVVNWEKESEKYPYLKRTEIPKPDERDKVQILLGTDYASLMTSSEVVEGGLQDPVAEKTKLGWAYSGTVKNCQVVETNMGEQHTASHVTRFMSLINMSNVKPEKVPKIGKRPCEIGTQADESLDDIIVSVQKVVKKISEVVERLQPRIKRRKKKTAKPECTVPLKKESGANRFIFTGNKFKRRTQQPDEIENQPSQDLNKERVQEMDKHDSSEPRQLRSLRRKRQRLKWRVAKEASRNSSQTLSI